MQAFSAERAMVDAQIDSYMQDTLFKNAAKRRRDQKYQCWLELFDLKDSAENQNKFLQFCKKNHINL